ncbi:unnamed protein product [Didymodactylos carnosus]|uniref:Peptidase M14 domain-containing protein n=1 Tax=Didymodactylos carnosus TaxID=1234261 RepID=A0A8S2FBJ7_9BILA|nr:unnamed protein product [Didymodactylos carnosus]CAF4216788.1 unnamed protein product [Didymodactylos carnosus]
MFYIFYSIYLLVSFFFVVNGRLSFAPPHDKDQIWLVKIPLVYSIIEKEFPTVDLLEQHEQFVYVCLIPRLYLDKFKHYVLYHHGTYKIIVSNVAEWNLKINKRRQKRSLSAYNNPLDSIYLERFLDYEEQQNWQNLLTKSSLTKNYVKLHPIGFTYENRTLTVVQISTKLNRLSKKKRAGVWIDAGMHAREWLSMGVANYIIIRLLTLKNENKKVKDVLKHFDFYILPMVNPDGYEYSRQTDRLWRRNRSPTIYSDFWIPHKSCSYGVDLNRNFPFEWDTYAGSRSPCQETYRGQLPASEAEVKNIIQFLTNKKEEDNDQFDPHRSMRVYFNLHTYGRYWLLPWSYTKHLKPNDFNSMLNRSAEAIKTMSTTMNNNSSYHNNNQTDEMDCSVGFFAGEERITLDGNEIFGGVIHYLWSLMRDSYRRMPI